MTPRVLLAVAAVTYLALGVICLAQVLYRRWRSGLLGRSSRMLEGLDPRRRAPGYRFRAAVLAPLLTAIGVVLAWPVAVWIDARAAWAQRRSRIAAQAELASIRHPARGVRQAHLRERLSRPEIEAREIVLDPLGAAPVAPFGLLNRQWTSFVAFERPGDTWWSFERVGRLPPHNDQYPDAGRHGRMRGYTIVRRGRPVASFICEITPSR